MKPTPIHNRCRPEMIDPTRRGDPAPLVDMAPAQWIWRLSGRTPARRTRSSFHLPFQPPSVLGSKCVRP